jgi:hypothetical protein
MTAPIITIDPITGDDTLNGSETAAGFVVRSGTDHLSLQGYGANELANATAGAQGYGPGTQIGLSDGTKIVFGDITSLKGVSLS